MTTELVLGIPGFRWADLFRPHRLAELDELFRAELRSVDPEAAARFEAYRASGGSGLKPEAISDVLCEVAPHLGSFVARMFGVEAERRSLMSDEAELAPRFRMKDQLVKRRALKRGEVPFDPALDAAGRRMLAAAGVRDVDDEAQVARFACELLDLDHEVKRGEPSVFAAASLVGRVAGAVVGAPALPEGPPYREVARDSVARCLDLLERWLLMRRRDPALRGWVAFRLPGPMEFDQLVQLRRPATERPEELDGPLEHRRHRDGFALTDPRMDRLEVRDQVEYCIYCHGRDKDSCSKGLLEKDGSYRKNPLGIPLVGCPLDEKISEAHLLRKQGDAIAALALVAIDNPLVPGTGHRICNDCMKSCIFQKQEPVNIPQIETGVLTDVLDLPWGFEIYGLLARWNPLNARRPYPLPYHGKNVLVIGLGPAGYTLAHHLAQEGFGVVGVDGLKLEPLPEDVVAHPVQHFRAVYDDLDDRTLYGFGGVSEYGITVRWDKNFLTLLYATLSRHPKLRMLGGVRFGGTITLDDAWSYGFDHVAVAAGAGKPTIIDLENNLLRGIRKASDFLMALQLTGAYKRSTLANLQVRLPAVVIGGGLTAIDTATELRAYYVVQCEKMLAQWEVVSADGGAEAALQRFDAEERAILDELLEHGRLLRAERERARQEGRQPDFDALLDAWGGVTIAYRKRLQDSPAYRLNHEEVIKCLEEGVRFAELLSPVAALPDERGALRAVTFERGDGGHLELPARTLCVAAGTSPNTTYEREHRGSFAIDKRGFFEAHEAVRGDDGAVRLEKAPGFFTSYLDERGRTVSFYGDNHPRYAGSVVKAMASAKDGYQAVARLFRADIEAALGRPAEQPARELAWERLAATVAGDVTATVVSVNRLTPTIVEVVVRAPNQARKFRPGQFYRLQNFETMAPRIGGTTLLMEGIALTGAWTDPDKGLLSMIVLEMGVSSRLCAALRPGEQVIVMGPTGAPTEIEGGEAVILAGGGLGNAVLFSIARAFRAAGSKVVYFAGYKNPRDLFKRDEIEEATDQVVWASDVGPAIEARRPQDRSFVGNIVQAMVAYAKGELGERVADLSRASRIIAIGSDRMMAAVAAARHGVLREHLKPDHVGIGSINSPMQCMMKEVCAQCLQRHVDPETGKPRSIVFSCFNQDQKLDEVDWKNLADRLRQNTVQEKLSSMVLDRLVARVPGTLRL